jgi:hydrogenase-4 component B
MNYFIQNSPFYVDSITAFFIIVILIVVVPSLIYSIGYFKDIVSPGKKYLTWALLFAFTLTMIAVVSVKNLLVFVFFWELMSLVSFFLVIFEDKQSKAVRAGIIYMIMTHIGTAFIIAGFFLFYAHAGSLDLFAIKTACMTMPEKDKTVIFLFLLAGFGTKAGMIPLHIWLPYAHPQAPSPVSAIMSGVMIKMGIYGMLRFIIFTMGVNTAWWGHLVLALAGLSCLIGVIYALMEHDLKKLLAYHSVENIGIILLGVGAAMLFINIKAPVLAVFALTAGLYHLINHASFKGLLFLGAGSVHKATGLKDIEKLGGLIKRMPVTAFTFLIGAMAISALPPLNGFVSEWLTFQAFFLGVLNSPGLSKIVFGLYAAVLALTGGLAVSCFVKAFGITFFALPRSQKAESAKESGFTMKAGMISLSLIVILLGLGAPVIIRLLTGVSGSILGIDTAGLNFSINNLFIAAPSGEKSIVSPAVIALLLGLLSAVVIAVVFIAAGKRKIELKKTWNCGYYRAAGQRNEYTATAFSKPFRILFNFFLMPYSKTEKIKDSHYHVRSFKYKVFITPVFNKYFYNPAIALVLNSARLFRKMQSGSIHIYIFYIFAALILLIVFRGYL